MEFPQHIQDILKNRYLLSGDAFKLYYGYDGCETWEMLVERVVKNVINPEEKELQNKTRDLILSLKFLPNSPTLFGAGLKNITLSACFVIKLEDSIEGWGEAIKKALKVQCSGGGCGFALHKLRPTGFPVRNKRATAAGPLAFLRSWNIISQQFKQAVRNGANMGLMRCDHPDILNFIDSKLNNKELTAFNISVALTDEFMQAILNGGNEDFKLRWNNEVVTSIKARSLWERIVNNAWLNGEPGVVFLDTFNQSNVLRQEEGDFYPNPCSEATLFEDSACNLGSINLSKFVKGNNFDYYDFEETIQTAYRFLDNLIDMNYYPDITIEQKVKQFRQIGLGIMGLADVFLKLGYRYGSPESLELTDSIMRRLRDVSLSMNEDLGRIKGNFLAYERYKDKFLRLGYKYKRNYTMNCVAPTGTLSLIAGCSSGIEPYFSFNMIRLIDNKPYRLSNVVCSYNNKEKDTALNLSIKEHIDVVKIAQKYIDMSVSKTINLKHDATIKDVAEAYRLAYLSGLKGVTVYRDGSREGQALQCIECSTMPFSQ